MPYITAAPVDPAFAPFVFFERTMGVVPGLFRAQTLLPRVIEAEAGLTEAVLTSDSALSRARKERLLLGVAGSMGNACCVAAHARMLRILGDPEPRIQRLAGGAGSPDLPAADAALQEFALRLALEPASVRHRHVQALRAHGLGDPEILDAVLVTGLGRFLCTVSAGLGVEPDAPPPSPWTGRRPGAPRAVSEPHPGEAEPQAGYIGRVEMSAGEFPPWRFFLERFGFVPNLFRAQTLRPAAVTAEAELIRQVLLTGDVLSRMQKETILLAVSARNLNTYLVAVHGEILRALGVPEERSERIALDHHGAGLSERDTALLDFAIELAGTRPAIGPEDAEALIAGGFTQAQLLEAVVMTGLTQLLATVQMGLGVTPDFPARLVFSPPAERSLKPAGAAADPTADEDAALVERLQAGDLEAFETLVREHGRRMYRTLIGILGSTEEAEDALQNAFLRVFKHVGSFRGESRFSTWLTRIAINEGLQRLRKRRPTESLAEQDEAGEEFVSRDVRSWEDSPETLYSRTQARSLVEKELVKLPAIYRVAVILRDIEQLSTEEAAAALAIPVGTLKTRLFRGRLMLREALAPYFSARDRGAAHA